MARKNDQIIIRRALEHPGLLASNELKFVMDLSRQPSHWRLTARQTEWLYQIGREKLQIPFPTPATEQRPDYRARACA